jgi:hypothetical protein
MLCNSDVVFASVATNEVSDYHSVRYVHDEAICCSQSTDDSQCQPKPFGKPDLVSFFHCNESLTSGERLLLP